MKSNKKAYTQLIMMLGLTMLIQLVSLLKSTRLAALFGTSVEMDAYNFVNNVATFIFSFIGAGVSAVLIPTMVKKTGSSKSRDSFITILYGMSFIVMFVVIALCRPVMEGFGGYSEKFVDVACGLMTIIMLGQYLYSINSISTAYLQCQNYYNIPKVMSLGITLVLTVVIYCSKNLTIFKFAIYSFSLISLEIIIQYGIAIYKGFRYCPCFQIKDPELRSLFRLFLPTVWGSGVYQLTVLADSFISSTLGTGNISILSYANMIASMINTVILNNIVLYIYPKIVAESDDHKVKNKLFKYMVFFCVLMCALLLLFFAAGYDAIYILFERGEFKTEATRSVFICVLIYLLGSPINIMRDVVYRYFYSRGNTKSTFYNGFFASIFNIAISIILSNYIGVYGVVWGTTITAVVSFSSILIRMREQYAFDGNFKPFVIEMVRLFFSMLLATVVCILIKSSFTAWPSLMVSIIAAIATVFVFAITLIMMKSQFYKVELG